MIFAHHPRCIAIAGAGSGTCYMQCERRAREALGLPNGKLLSFTDEERLGKYWANEGTRMPPSGVVLSSAGAMSSTDRRELAALADECSGTPLAEAAKRFLETERAQAQATADRDRLDAQSYRLQQTLVDIEDRTFQLEADRRAKEANRATPAPGLLGLSGMTKGEYEEALSVEEGRARAEAHWSTPAYRAQEAAQKEAAAALMNRELDEYLAAHPGSSEQEATYELLTANPGHWGAA